VLDSIDRTSWSWTDYLIRRMSRLYIVPIPALLLILAWDGVGAELFRAPGLYGDFISSVAFGGHSWIVHSRSVAAIVGNLAFLMTIYVPVLGSGGALWSLSNEFWYYILFPFIALSIARRGKSSQVVVYVIVIWAVVFFVGREIVEWMSVWLLGVAAVRAPRIQIPAVTPKSVLAAAFGVFVLVTLLEHRTVNVISLSGDIAVGVGFAMFLYAAFCRDAATPASAAAPRFSRPWEQLAGFSYTLYLFHQPPLAFANAWLSYARHSRWQPTLGHVLLMLTVVVAIVVYSYGASRCTEARTDQLRRLIAGYVHRRRQSRLLAQLVA
jgi:peptidoglycan/LPS O-acetylase OafA/YrhL